MRIRLFAILFLIGGPILAYMGWQEKQKLANIEAKGVTVPGIIEGGEWKSGRKGGKTYKFEVAYKQQDGALKKQTFNVKSDFFSQHVIGDAISNENVQVKYVPGGTSEDVILVGGSTSNTEMFMIGLIGGGLGLLGCLYFFVLAKGQ